MSISDFSFRQDSVLSVQCAKPLGFDANTNASKKYAVYKGQNDAEFEEWTLKQDRHMYELIKAEMPARCYFDVDFDSEVISGDPLSILEDFKITRLANGCSAHSYMGVNWHDRTFRFT